MDYRILEYEVCFYCPHSNALPTTSFCILQAIKNLQWEWPGNEAKLSPEVAMLLLKPAHLHLSAGAEPKPQGRC